MRKRWMLMFVSVLALTLGSTGFQAQQDQTAGPAAFRHFNNPKPFDKFAAPVSAPIAFLFSDRGKAMLKASRHPLAPFLLKQAGVEPTGAGKLPGAPDTLANPQPGESLLNPEPGQPLPNLQPGQTGTPLGILPSFPGTVNSTCGSAVGTRFNKEPATGTPPAPFALPQNEGTVDAIVDGVATGVDLVVGGANDYRGFLEALSNDPAVPGSGSATGYYVQRSGNDCVPDFEGGAPELLDPFGEPIFGLADPVVARDPARGAFFEADLRLNDETTAIGVNRTTRANLLSTGPCPNGTHTTDAVARTCWPIGVLVNPLPTFFGDAFFQDKPHMAVDERTSGTGAGSVYITATEFSFFDFFTRIWLVACKNDLSACSSPTLISGGDLNTQFSHVSVRPDGVITVSYGNYNFFPNADIKFVTCSPGAGAPATPSCSPPTLVATETQVLAALGSNDFRVTTYPKHDHRMNGNNIETFIVWERCHIPPLFPSSFTTFYLCPKSDVVMAESQNGGPFSSPTVVDTSPRDQFFSWIKADRVNGTVNIAYYTAEADYFSHRVQVKLAQINPLGTFPEAVSGFQILTTQSTDPGADLFLGDTFFGDYIGVVGASNPGNTTHHAYVHFTHNFFTGTYGGLSHPEQNNYISRFDY